MSEIAEIPPERAEQIRQNIAAVRGRMTAACERAGRETGSVRLLLATKTVDPAAIRVAIEAGEKLVAENRVQEVRPKYEALEDLDYERHFIGHLQSNKAKQVPGLFGAVDSVDRASIVDALDKAATRHETTLDVLVQVNVAGEAQKSGCDPAEAAALLERIAATETLTPRGLMTIAPIDAEGDALRAVFRALRELRDDLQRRFPDLGLRELSMGMSNDYREAIAEGATQVRIGRAIFGER